MRKYDTREDAILAWHFVRDDRSLGFDAEGLLVEPGFIYYTDSPIELCQVGLHACVDPFDALDYAKGGYLCRVAVWGDVKIGSDKIAGRNREVLAAHDITRELRLFGCWCARQVWHLLTDERSRTAVEVAERFANGQATKEERAAAAGAAWSAAAAAGAAWSARAAAGAETARAGAAAETAWAAAGAVTAWAAAGAAWLAWSAASHAAGAASAATRYAQRAEFNRLIAERFAEVEYV